MSTHPKTTVVTFTLLNYPVRYWYRAFANMGRWLMRPFQAEGLRFQKLMGSGRHFSAWPDWSTYVFLGVWDSEEAARNFFGSGVWANHTAGTTATGTLWLQPYQSHGQWDGLNPFECDPEAARPPGGPVAVLTRATIRTGALIDFWRHVPQARARLKSHADDLLFSVGVGEKPVVQQCTVSVWQSEQAISQFAYRESGHKEVVRRTRERRWYTEELFARFSVTGANGSFAEQLHMTEPKTASET